jgi:hypothetical protein
MPRLKQAPPTGDHVGEFTRRRDARADQNARARSAKPPEAEVPLGTFSGHCLTEAEIKDGQYGAVAVDPDDVHGRCAGGVTNGVGKFTPCLCPGHDAEFKCHQCKHVFGPKHEGDYDEEHRRCIDQSACASRIAHASQVYRQGSPLHQQIDQIYADVADRQKAAREQNLAAMHEANKNPRPESGPASAEPRVASGRGKLAQKCHCGCGGMTKGGRFVAGHDMKLKGRLFGVARKPTGAEFGMDAATEIVARGWNTAGIDPKLLAEARRVVEVDTPVLVIQARVRDRYDDDTLVVA